MTTHGGRPGWNRGQHPTDEVRAKMRAAHLGVPHSPEHRAAIARGMAAAWARRAIPEYRVAADRTPRVILALLLAASAVRAQVPNLLVSVALNGQHVVVEAVLTGDSTLLLPAADVHALLGLPVPPTAWTTTAAITRQFPSVAITVNLRALTVVVDDPLGVLPASRAIRDRAQRQARGVAYVARSGPFLALTADDAGRSAIDAGYSWRGRVAVTGRHSSMRGAAWAVSLAPSPRLFVSYADGDRSPPSASARVAAGPAWAFATWTPTAWSIDGLVTVGRVSLFASSRDAYAITINAHPVGLQLGRAGQHTTAKLTYGPLMPSPFSVPLVR